MLVIRCAYAWIVNTYLFVQGAFHVPSLLTPVCALWAPHCVSAPWAASVPWSPHCASVPWAVSVPLCVSTLCVSILWAVPALAFFPLHCRWMGWGLLWTILAHGYMYRCVEMSSSCGQRRVYFLWNLFIKCVLHRQSFHLKQSFLGGDV